MSKDGDRYQATYEDEKEAEKEASEKAGALGARAVADYYTGGKYETIRTLPVVHNVTDAAEGMAGKVTERTDITGLGGKMAKMLDDKVILDKADEGAGYIGNKGNAAKNAAAEQVGKEAAKETAAKQAENQASKQAAKKSSDSIDSSDKKESGKSGKKKGLGNKLKGLFGSDDDSSDDEELTNDSFDAGDFLSKGFKFTKLKIILVCACIFLFMIMGLGVILSATDQGNVTAATSENSCTKTSSANESTKTPARFTHYFSVEKGKGQYSLGAVKDIRNHIKSGKAYFNSDGYAIWKGGSTYNGKKYGEDGIEYHIVATANKKLIGTCQTLSCSIRYKENPDIHYFEYGDTFSLEITKKGGNKEVVNAIVLDSCGACMDWALSSTGLHRPTSTYSINQCKKSSGYKIDFYCHLQNDTKSISDMGYIMTGTTSNTCVGQVDLGNLVVGTSDTKLLQNKSLLDLFGMSGLADLNKEITNNVQKWGAGTGNGVAAAAITLINSIKAKGYRLPYYWAGGHGSIIAGVSQTWGALTKTSVTNGGTPYYYDSLDCSGFVSWAIRNGGCTNFKSGLGTATLKDYGVKETAEQAKAGDILIMRQGDMGHVLVVVQNNNGNIILAESSGGTGGIHFSQYVPSKFSNYVFRDMSGFYNSKSCK